MYIQRFRHNCHALRRMEARPHTLYTDAFIGLETIDGDASVNLRSQLPFSVQSLGSLIDSS